jgi:hypothetical protein
MCAVLGYLARIPELLVREQEIVLSKTRGTVIA